MAIFDEYDKFFDEYQDYMLDTFDTFDTFGEIIESETDDQLLMIDMESYIDWDEE